MTRGPLTAPFYGWKEKTRLRGCAGSDGVPPPKFMSFWDPQSVTLLGYLEAGLLEM